MTKTRKDSEVTRAAKSAAAKAAATARRRAKEIDPPNPIGGFMSFVRTQGVVGLAVGLALGTQLKTLVDQIFASFINPMLGLLLPGKGKLSDKVFHLTIADKTETFAWGALIYVVISFLAIIAIIYFIIKALKLDKLDKPKS